MPNRVCLVHYHEIGLKGKNRATFENQLVNNLRRALRGYAVADVRRVSGHLLVTDESGRVSDEMAAAIARVPGVARVSLAYLCSLSEQEYCGACDFFRFSGTSLYVYAASQVGVGGLPVGTAGKVVTLLSSGFDSPVATWMVGRRGAICVPVHFSGRPMTADTSEWLCQDIVNALEPAGIIGRLYVVPFGERQREISLAVPQSLRIITYRRVMFAVSERIARIEGAKALVTGESLGQVASQTLENIAAVNEVVSLPVLRPLIGSDKQEIMRRAEQIGTHEISSQAAEDCCTLFMPRRPETHARLDAVHEAWDSFDHDAMIDELVDNVEYLDFDQCPSYHPPREMRAHHSYLGPRKA